MRQLEYILLLAMMLLGCRQTVNAQVRIYGRVVDARQAPIAGVNCILLDLPDSMQIAGTKSDLEGRFGLDVKEDKEYILQLSFVGYEKMRQACKPGNLGDIVLNESATRIKILA